VAEVDLQLIVGLNLAKVRKARGLSQEELADELQFHRTYLGAVERGERNLTLKSVERLADKLGVGPLHLLKPVRAGRRSSR
jgi:transcriptional regulator with XRE-family HTH domain